MAPKTLSTTGVCHRANALNAGRDYVAGSQEALVRHSDASRGTRKD